MDFQNIAHYLLSYGRSREGNKRTSMEQQAVMSLLVSLLKQQYAEDAPDDSLVARLERLRQSDHQEVTITRHKSTTIIKSKLGGFTFTFPSPIIDNVNNVLVPPTLVADMTRHLLFPKVPWNETVYAPIFKWCAAYAEESGFNSKTYSRFTDLTTVAYFNFKSHFIFDESRRIKMERLVARFNLRFLCMAEALVPDALADGLVQGLSRNTQISQPYSRYGKDGPDLERGSRAFWNMKVAKSGGQPRQETVQWMPGWDLEAATFGNPYFCPYGSNWGNLVLSNGNMTADPMVVHLFPHADDASVLAELRAFNASLNADEGVEEARSALSQEAKMALYAIREHKGGMQGRCLESRCMISVSIPGYVVFSTHLEDRDESVRQAQLDVALDVISGIRDEGVSVLLIGDLNMVHLGAYTAEEQDRLTALLPPGKRLPELDARLTNEPFVLCNPHVKHESIFCKNVCHIVRAEGGGNTFSDLDTGCVYSDAGDHSMQVVGWNTGGS